jgi:hypothetical protein
MPVGLLVGLAIHAALVALTVTAPRRPRLVAAAAFRVASAYNEAPFVFVYLVVVSSLGQLSGIGSAPWESRATLGLAALVVGALLIIAWWGRRERPLVMQALDDGLGPAWRQDTPTALIGGMQARPPLDPDPADAFRPPAGLGESLPRSRLRDRRPPQPAGSLSPPVTSP